MDIQRVKGLVVLAILLALSSIALVFYDMSRFPVILVRPLQMTVSILIGLTVYYFIYGISPAAKGERLRFTLRKVAAFVGVAIALIGILATWVQEITIIALSAGLAAAGISFSLREPISSFVGWLVIILNRPFSIGDRVMINVAEGDVIDFNIFQVRLMEIGQWTDSNMYTGRILSVPTSWILTHSVYNYTQDFNFIWDRIWIGLLYGEDFKKVADKSKEITEAITRETIAVARKSYEKLSDKYFSHESIFEPSVYLSFNSNWIELNIRYVTDARFRTKTRSRISSSLLDYLYSNGIKVASTSMNINLTAKDDDNK